MFAIIIIALFGSVVLSVAGNSVNAPQVLVWLACFCWGCISVGIANKLFG